MIRKIYLPLLFGCIDVLGMQSASDNGIEFMRRYEVLTQANRMRNVLEEQNLALLEEEYIYTNDTFEVLDDLYRIFFKKLIYENRDKVQEALGLVNEFFSNNSMWYLYEGTTNEL